MSKGPRLTSQSRAVRPSECPPSPISQGYGQVGMMPGPSSAHDGIKRTRPHEVFHIVILTSFWHSGSKLPVTV